MILNKYKLREEIFRKKKGDYKKLQRLKYS